jgi:hypothetical protein
MEERQKSVSGASRRAIATSQDGMRPGPRMEIPGILDRL